MYLFKYLWAHAIENCLDKANEIFIIYAYIYIYIERERTYTYV